MQFAGRRDKVRKSANLNQNRKLFMNSDPGQFGKILLYFGLMLVLAGLIVMGLSKLGLFRLPGDLEFGGKNWRVFIPITTCIVLSVILTLILWIIHYFKR